MRGLPEIAALLSYPRPREAKALTGVLGNEQERSRSEDRLENDRKVNG